MYFAYNKNNGLNHFMEGYYRNKRNLKIIYQLNLTELKTNGFVNLILIKFSFCYKI